MVIEAGSTFDLTVQLLKPNGQPFDLSDFSTVSPSTGLGLRSRFRETDKNGSIVFTADIGNGPRTNGPFYQNHIAAAYGGTGIDVDTSNDSFMYILEPASLGQIRIVISSIDTAALQTDGDTAGVYDIEAVGPVDSTPNVTIRKIRRILQGAWGISTESTR